MGHHKSESPRYPKSHIMAASGIAAALSIFLLVIPTTEVEAKRTLVQLDLHEVTAEHKEPVLAEELAALISEPVAYSSAIQQPRMRYTASPAVTPDVLRGGLSLHHAPLAAQRARSEWTSVSVDVGDTLS